MKKQGIFTMVLLSLLVPMLAACVAAGGGSGSGGGNGGGAASAATPADGAKAFFTALFTGSNADAQTLVCSALAEGAEEMTTAFNTMKTVLTVGGGSIDISGLTYTTTSESGDTAQVQVGGTLKSSQEGVSELEFPSLNMPMVKEGGVWKACA